MELLFQLFSRLKWRNAIPWERSPLTKPVSIQRNFKRFLKFSLAKYSSKEDQYFHVQFIVSRHYSWCWTDQRKIHCNMRKFTHCLFHFWKQKFFSIWEKRHEYVLILVYCQDKMLHWGWPCTESCLSQLQHKIETQYSLSHWNWPTFKIQGKAEEITENSGSLTSPNRTLTPQKVSLKMSPMSGQKSVPSAIQFIIFVQYITCRFTNHKEFTECAFISRSGQ